MRKDKDEQKEIASERIQRLFELADEEAKNKNLELATKYVKSARSISMRFRVRIPKEQKVRMCKFCYGYMKPGINSRTRLNSKLKRVEVECLNCNRMMYFPYSRKKK